MTRLKKLLCISVPVAMFCAAASFTHATPDASALIISGCEGEGCGETRDSESNKDFVLYQDMQLDSNIIGKYPTGTKATNLGAYTKIIERGKSKVTSVLDASTGLKAGDEIDTVFHEGEGSYVAYHKGKSVSYSYDGLVLEELSPPKYETWFKSKVGTVSGYSPVFPFQGSLE